MNALAFRTSPAGRAGELALWTSAAVLMLSVHVGGALYLMREPPLMAADNQPPAAIMIELAPEPEAVNVEDEQVSTETTDSQEVKSETVEPVEEPLPEPVPEPVTEPEPVEPPPPEEVVEPEPEREPKQEVTETIPEPLPEPIPEIDPIEQQVLAALENVEVPLPMTRPPVQEKKPEPKKTEKKIEKRKPRQQPQARQETAEAKLQTQQSTRTAASQTSSGSSSSSVSPARWQSKVLAHLKRRQRYPSEARSQNQEGTATVRFQIDNSGNVTSVSLSRSSGFPALDAEVVSLVKRASPIPAPPENVSKTLTVPINFSLR